MIDITEEFRAFLADNGIVVVEPMIADKQLHRINIEGQRRGRKNGAYVLHPDPPPSGFFEDHSTGIKLKWRSKSTPTEKLTKRQIKAQRRKIERARRKREAEEAAKWAAGAAKAATFWREKTRKADAHDYIVTKKINGTYGARIGDWVRFVRNELDNLAKIIIPDSLIVPMYDETGDIVNLQAIFRHPHPILNRNKDFHPGCKTKGAFFWIGPRSDTTDCTLLIAEGFATAASLFEETGCRVYVAFSAGNLQPVAEIVRRHLPSATIIVAADNDKTPGNPGITFARKAAAAVGGKILIPPGFGDWNDHITANK